MSLSQQKRSAAITLETLRRARAQRRERGTLFVEALPVVLLTGVLLATVGLFHGGYYAKAETQQRARALAWLSAASGCELQSPEVLAAAQPAQVRLTAPGNGVFPHDTMLSTRTTVTCNEPLRREDVTLADALNTLRKLVPWEEPIDMARWLLGASQPFANLFGAMEFVGRWVSFASEGVSGSFGALVQHFGEALAWVTRATEGALTWVTSLL